MAQTLVGVFEDRSEAQQVAQELIAQEPQRWHIFDALQPVEALAEQIAHELSPWLDHIQTLEPTTP